MVPLVMPVVRVLQVMPRGGVLQVMSRVMATLVRVLQAVSRLVLPLVLPMQRVLEVMVWGLVSLEAPMARVLQAMHRVMALPFMSIVRVLHRVMVRLLCAAGGATGDGEAGGAVARMLQAMQRVCDGLCPAGGCP